MICQYKVSVYNALVDFALVMKSLLSQFEQQQIRCAAIGGFALWSSQTDDGFGFPAFGLFSKAEQIVKLPIRACSLRKKKRN
jgi:hypothetical protein